MRSVQVGVTALMAGGLSLGLQLWGPSPATAEEPKITITVGPADAETGSVRVRVNLREGCYDGFADFPRSRCWNASTPLQLQGPDSTSQGAITGMRWKGSSGSFTYTPTANARHAAAKLAAPASDKRDRFRVTLVDSKGGTLTAPVRVNISPLNTFPHTRSSGGNTGATSARASSDSFTITVTDGYGGSLQVPVTVSG